VKIVVVKGSWFSNMDLERLGAGDSSGSARNILDGYVEADSVVIVSLGPCQDVLTRTLDLEVSGVESLVVRLSPDATGSGTLLVFTDPVPVLAHACVTVDLDVLSLSVDLTAIVTRTRIRYDTLPGRLIQNVTVLADASGSTVGQGVTGVLIILVVVRAGVLTARQAFHVDLVLGTGTEVLVAGFWRKRRFHFRTVRPPTA